MGAPSRLSMKRRCAATVLTRPEARLLASERESLQALVHSPRYRSDGVLIVVTRPEQRLGCPLGLLGDQGNNSSGAVFVVYFAKTTMSSLRGDRLNISPKELAGGM
jgi:hypothetical protein